MLAHPSLLTESLEPHHSLTDWPSKPVLAGHRRSFISTMTPKLHNDSASSHFGCSADRMQKHIYSSFPSRWQSLAAMAMGALLVTTLIHFKKGWAGWANYLLKAAISRIWGGNMAWRRLCGFVSGINREPAPPTQSGWGLWDGGSRDTGMGVQVSSVPPRIKVCDTDVATLGRIL